jgi:Predicted xylanase/chitin deacetylase
VVGGRSRILDVLKQNDVKATFFCTGNFAENAPEVMQRIMDEGHEVACHGVDHWQPKETDFAPFQRDCGARLWTKGLWLSSTPYVPC